MSACFCLCGGGVEGHQDSLPAKMMPYSTSADEMSTVAMGSFSTSPKKPSGHLAKVNAKCQQCGFSQHWSQGNCNQGGFDVILKRRRRACLEL